MNAPFRPTAEDLRLRLLERLRPLVAGTAMPPGQHARGPGIFSYCATARERIARTRLAHPIIGIVLRGRKEIWLGELCRELERGEAFVLPAEVDFDAVNIPDAGGLYETLLIEVAQVPASVPAPSGRPRGRVANLEIRLPLAPDLVDAICHAAAALTSAPHAEALAGHRLAEVLLLVRDVPQARPLFATGLADRVRWLVLSDPGRAWPAEDIARHLAMGSSTLRRKLRAEGASLREVLREARLSVARDVLQNQGSSVAEAAEAAGYASRSHFARQYRARFGNLPRDAARAPS